MPVRLATRGSPQASTQAEAVADQLREATGCDVELVVVETTGDRRQDVPLHVIGGQGVFVKEVQQAVLDGRADAGVHSAKDLPSTRTTGLVIAAFTRRRDAADALIGRSLAELADGRHRGHRIGAAAGPAGGRARPICGSPSCAATSPPVSARSPRTDRS